MERTALVTAQCHGTTLKPRLHFCQINRYTCCLERPSAAHGLRQHSRSMNQAACDTNLCEACDGRCVLRQFGAWYRAGPKQTVRHISTGGGLVLYQLEQLTPFILAGPSKLPQAIRTIKSSTLNAAMTLLKGVTLHDGRVY